MRTSRHNSRRTRRNLLWGSAGIALFMAVILLIPGILVNRFEVWEPVSFLPLQPKEEIIVEEEPLLVPVYLTKQGKTVEVPLEEYVRGVLAAEMPVGFELEALKAQAIAARTYVIRRLESGDATDMPPEANGAIVTDTVMHQAYATEEALRERWGFFAYSRNLDKLTMAVNETKGMVILFDGKPIEATFFSTSNGYTENSEDYWQAEIPYLRSVESPWDQLYAPNVEREASFGFREFYHRLGLRVSDKTPSIHLTSISPGGRILKAKVAGKTFTGREIREKLELSSTDFSWKVAGKQIVFTTIGYGHGVGMSQWGANGMAKQGKTAEDILKHYYSGVRLEMIDSALVKM
jgi:stage II sporulation protein D